MRKTTKRRTIIFTACSALLLMFMGIGFVGTQKASADTVPSGFAMEAGASVRIRGANSETFDGSGIRFKTNLTKQAYNEIVSKNEGWNISFETIVTTRPVADISALQYVHVNGTDTQAAKWDVQDFATYFETNDSYTEYTALVNWPKERYRHVVTARSVAVLTKEGETTKYIYTDAVDTRRSMASVAAEAIYQKAEDYEYLYAYLGTDASVERSETYTLSEADTIYVAGVSNLVDPVVIIGANQYNATLAGDSITLSDGIIDALTVGNTYNLTIAGSNGAVYSSIQTTDNAVIDSGVTIETKGAADATISLSQDLGNVQKVLLDGVDVLSAYENKKLTLDKDKLPTDAASLGEDVSMTVVSDTGVYFVKADIYTKIIKSASELDKLFTEYATKTEVGKLSYSSTEHTMYAYDGYFLLGASIDYQGETYQNGVTAQLLNNSGASEIVGDSGFAGVFDGNGYTISNIAFNGTESSSFVINGGLFGAISKEGIVKNLALTNVNFAGGTTAPLATVCCGAVDNVYIYANKGATSTQDTRWAMLSNGTLGAQLSNIFIRKDSFAGKRYRCGYISAYDILTKEGVKSSAENVYIYFEQNQHWIVQYENEGGNPYGANGTRAFTNVIVYNQENTNTADANYGPFVGGLDYRDASAFAADFSGGKIVFKDTTLWDMTGSYPTFKAKEAMMTELALSATPIVDKNDAATLTIDLSEFSGAFNAITGASFAGVDVFASASGLSLTLDAAKIPNDSSKLGEDKLLTLSTDNGVFAIRVDIYTKVIRTAEDLNKMYSEYMTVTEIGSIVSGQSVTVSSYDGYFVLGANINYGGNVFANGVTFGRMDYVTNWDNYAAAGFKGVFDGKGYTISNIQFQRTGAASGGFRFGVSGSLFGAIASTGVVKNFALDCTLAGTNGMNATIAGVCAGTIDNVSITVATSYKTDGAQTACVALSTYGAKLTNIFVAIKAGNWHSGAGAYISVYDKARGEVGTTAKNVYIYTVDSTIANLFAQYENTSDANPYKTGVFANVVVYNEMIDSSSVYANGLTYKMRAAYSAGDIVFDDATLWQITDGGYYVISNGSEN